jgi:guanylate kinase
MMNAKDEIALADKYDHFIINDDLEKAYKELTDIIILNKNSGLTLEAGLSHKSKLLEEFKNLKIFK